MTSASSLYIAYQINGGQEPWQIAQEVEKQRILDEIKPRYISALASTQNTAKINDFSGDLIYRGDAYFDFDAKPDSSETVEDAIQRATEAAQQFIKKLEAHGVNPRSLRIYATGSKGFHVEIPEATYTEDAPVDYKNLPGILRELAFSVYVDCLDLAVYSRGHRMWRCPNVKRENDRYKVPISYDELTEMTPEKYAELTASPRPAPDLDPPSLAPAFCDLFDEAEKKASAITAKKPKVKTSSAHEIIKTSPDSLKYAVVNRSLNVEQFIADYGPEGFWSGGVYRARNPKRPDDRNPGSFIIWPDGSWRDFAIEVGGGDLISLYAYLECDDNQAFALMKLTPPSLDVDAEVSRMKGEAYKATTAANDPKEMTLEWLMAQEFKPPKTLIRSILHVGLTVVAGAPKVGKSWFADDLALCVAAGVRALNGEVAQQAGVLFITPDDQNLGRFRDRCLQIMQARGIHNVPKNFDFRLEWPRIGSGGIELLADYLDVHPDCALVVIDCLIHMMPMASKNQDRYASEMAALASLRKLANDRDIAIVALHHTRKAKSDDIFDSTSGTNGINGGADTIAVLSRVRGTDMATLAITGRSIEEGDFGLSMASGVWQVQGSAAAVKLSGARKALVDAIARLGGTATAKQLAAATGKDRSVILRGLHDLEEAGLAVADKSANEHTYRLSAA